MLRSGDKVAHAIRKGKVNKAEREEVKPEMQDNRNQCSCGSNGLGFSDMTATLLTSRLTDWPRD